MYAQVIAPPDPRYAALGLETPDTAVWAQMLSRLSPHHLFGTDELVELGTGQHPHVDRGLTQRTSGRERTLGDFRCVVVAELRAERSHQHQRVADVSLDVLLARFEAGRAVLLEALTGVREQPHRVPAWSADASALQVLDTGIGAPGQAIEPRPLAGDGPDFLDLSFRLIEQLQRDF